MYHRQASLDIRMTYNKYMYNSRMNSRIANLKHYTPVLFQSIEIINVYYNTIAKLVVGYFINPTVSESPTDCVLY